MKPKSKTRKETNIIHHVPALTEDKPWADVHLQIDDDTCKEEMTDIDTLVAWKLGLAAWKEAHKWGGKFLHEFENQSKP